MEAARRWALGGPSRQGGALADEMRALGAPEEVARAWEEEPSTIPDRGPGQALDVLPEAWCAIALFLDVSTQWRLAGMAAIPVGLDYAAVAVVARARRLRLDGELLDDLRIMEGAAIAAFAEARRER